MTMRSCLTTMPTACSTTAFTRTDWITPVSPAARFCWELATRFCARNFHAPRRQIIDAADARKILVTLGGSDAENVSEKVIQRLPRSTFPGLKHGLSSSDESSFRRFAGGGRSRTPSVRLEPR